MPNVLIFESDLEFANELQTELSNRDCQVAIVEDATVGLQQAASDPPDLILLCTELPRMNGFSVCNRLKRDPKLQSVPVIIMSANASEETFQQHRNLPKKCADDYVHKPITFNDFLPRIEALLPLNGHSTEDTHGDQDAGDAEPAELILDDDVYGDQDTDDAEPADLILDDDIELDDVEELDADELASAEFGELSDDLPPELPSETAEEISASLIDEEPPEESRAAQNSVDRFADDAFEALVEERPTSSSRPASAPPRASSPPTTSARPPRRSSLPPHSSSFPPTSLDASGGPPSTDGTHRRLAHLELELSNSQDRVQELEQRLAQLQRTDEHLHQELDEARARLESGASGIKAKDILDLREALNNKDKELLELRDQLTRREKELLGVKDTALDLERQAADTAERLVELNKQQHVAERAQQAAIQDRDQAIKRADEFKRKLERSTEDYGQAREQLQQATTELAQLKSELEFSRGDAEELNSRVEELQNELIQAKTQLRELESRNASELEALTSGRAEAERRLAKAEEQLDLSQSQAAEALETLDNERSRVSSLADALSTAVDQLRELSSGGAR